MSKKCPNTPCMCNFGGECHKYEMEDDTVGPTPCVAVTETFDNESVDDTIRAHCDQLICLVSSSKDIKSMTIVVDDAHAQVILHSGSKSVGDWSENGTMITIVRK